MGLDQRPATWGGDRPRVSARLKPCKCGGLPVAGTDTAGMWGAHCYYCSYRYLGDDLLWFETWQELVRAWNASVKPNE